VFADGRPAKRQVVIKTRLPDAVRTAMRAGFKPDPRAARALGHDSSGTSGCGSTLYIQRSPAYWAQVDDILEERGGLRLTQFQFHLKSVLKTKVQAVKREMAVAAVRWLDRIRDMPERAPLAPLRLVGRCPANWPGGRDAWESAKEFELRHAINNREPNPWCCRCAGPVHRSEWVPSFPEAWLAWQLCGGCHVNGRM